MAEELRLDELLRESAAVLLTLRQQHPKRERRFAQVRRGDLRHLRPQQANSRVSRRPDLMTRRLVAITLVLLAAVALATCGIVSRISDGHLDIEQAELQARIAPRFPTHHCKLLIACLELSNPVVVLTEGEDRIGLTADAKVVLGTRERIGRVGFSARPRYVPAEGQLVLDDLQITTLELTGFPAEYAEIVKRSGPALLKDQLQSRPVYTINAGTAKGAFAKLTVRDVKIVNGKLRVSFISAGA